MENNTLTSIIKEIHEISLIVRQGKSKSNSTLNEHLKSFNDSTFMRVLNTATTIGGFVVLILGSDILMDKLNLSKQTIKRIKEATVFTIIGCLLFAWLFIEFNQRLSNKKNQPNPEENNKHHPESPEGKPPDTQNTDVIIDVIKHLPSRRHSVNF
jgi:hypothetical protein